MIFGKKTQALKGDQLSFKIKNMQCVSCAMSIDAELEELNGVYSSSTKFSLAKTAIRYNSQVIKKSEIQDKIEALGYQVDDDD